MPHVLPPVFTGLEPLLAALKPNPVYMVGGAVRAAILGNPLQGLERDFCTPALPEEIAALAKAAGLTVGVKGAAWGCLEVAGTEITSFRTDTYTPGSRHPKVQFGVPMAQDALRRDFTCNAVYLSPNGDVFDPFNGADHLKAGHVVWVGNPLIKLAEDPIRWWRWLRFCALYGVAGLLQPRGVTAPNHVQDFALLDIANAVLASRPHPEHPRWLAERQKVAQSANAQALCSTLNKGLAQSPKALETLMP